jgi:hypothetical protein
MALTLGRIGLATGSGGDGRTLNEPFEWAQSGQQITLQGVYKASSDADAVSFANGVTGLDPAIGDEPWIPITSSTVSRIDGYYRVAGATAGFARSSLGTGTLLVDWQVQLERPRLFRRPRIEIPAVFAGLSNTMGTAGASLTSYTVGMAIPTGTLTRIDSTYGAVAPVSATRAGETGTVDFYYAASVPIATSSSVTWAQIVAPASYYVGSASVIDSVGPMHGRRDIDIASCYTLGNGLVRLTASSSDLSLTWWTGSAWSTARTVQICNEISGTTYPWTLSSCQILHNAPEACVMRLSGTSSFAVGGEVSIDVQLRRGDRCFRVVAATQNSAAGLQIRYGTAIPATSTTYGIRNTTALSSEYIVLTADNASTKTTATQGKLTNPTSRNRGFFGIGITSGGSTGTGVDAADGVGAQLYQAVGETVRVVFG